jgi:hypothetical protein
VKAAKQNHSRSPEVSGIEQQTGWHANLRHSPALLLIVNDDQDLSVSLGGVLRAMLAMRIGFSDGTRIATRVGQVLAVGRFVARLAWNQLIGAFFWFAATQEAARVH